MCILLDTCGHYFDHGSTKKKLDAFLVFFQCYLFTKRQPLPLEVEHMVQDSCEALRPDLELFKTHQEAVEAALELEKKYKDKIGECTKLWLLMVTYNVCNYHGVYFCSWFFLLRNRWFALAVTARVRISPVFH